jgi:hypothetical protein
LSTVGDRRSPRPACTRATSRINDEKRAETLTETLAKTETLAETLARTETLAETLARTETLTETLGLTDHQTPH